MVSRSNPVRDIRGVSLRAVSRDGNPGGGIRTRVAHRQREWERSRPEQPFTAQMSASRKSYAAARSAGVGTSSFLAFTKTMAQMSDPVSSAAPQKNATW